MCVCVCVCMCVCVHDVITSFSGLSFFVCLHTYKGFREQENERC